MSPLFNIGINSLICSSVATPAGTINHIIFWPSNFVTASLTELEAIIFAFSSSVFTISALRSKPTTEIPF